MNKFNGKVVLVTGGSAGIGLAAATAFAAEGASVYITGRRQPELDAAIKRIGYGAVAIKADAASLADIDSVMARISAERGKLDVLYANAGFYEFGGIADLTEAHYDRTFDVNVKSAVFTVQKALPLMADGGAILLTGSIAGSKGMEAFSIYGASKAAIRSLARGWTADLKARNIRVNVISPGPIATPGLAVLGGGETSAPTLYGALAGMVPMGRLGTPEEIARAAVFLASDDASYISGIELFVDGGAGQI